MRTYLTKTEQKLIKKFGPELLYEETILRPVHVNGSGKWSSNYRSSKVDAQIQLLKDSGLFHYESGNDAPRGGACGEYHKFTPKRKRLKLMREVEDAAAKRSYEKMLNDRVDMIMESVRRKIVRTLLSDANNRAELKRLIETARGSKHQKYQTGCWKFAQRHGVPSRIVKGIARQEI